MKLLASVIFLLSLTADLESVIFRIKLAHNGHISLDIPNLSDR